MSTLTKNQAENAVVLFHEAIHRHRTNFFVFDELGRCDEKAHVEDFVQRIAALADHLEGEYREYALRYRELLRSCPRGLIKLELISELPYPLPARSK